MAVFENTRALRGADTGLGRTFSTVIETLRVWNDTRVTRKELSRLTDRELDDIGLVRGDIKRIRA